MIKYESDCVGCQLPCLYKYCPHYQAEVHVCDRDRCNKKAHYCIDGEDLCEEHAAEELNEIIIDGLSIKEKAEIAGLEAKSYF